MNTKDTLSAQECAKLYESLWHKIVELEHNGKNPDNIKNYSEQLFFKEKNGREFSHWLLEGTNTNDVRIFYRRYDAARREGEVYFDKYLLYNSLVYMGYSLSPDDKLIGNVPKKERTSFRKTVLERVDKLKEKFFGVKNIPFTDQTSPKEDTDFFKEKESELPKEIENILQPLKYTTWYCFELEDTTISQNILTILPFDNNTRSKAKFITHGDTEKIWEGEANYIKDDNLLIVTLFHQEKEYIHFTIQVANQIEYTELCLGQKTFTDPTKKGICTKKVFLTKIHSSVPNPSSRKYNREEFDLLYPTIKNFLFNEQFNELVSFETPTVYNMQTFEQWHNETKFKSNISGLDIRNYSILFFSRYEVVEEGSDPKIITSGAFLSLKEGWAGQVIARLDVTHREEDMAWQGIVDESREDLLSVNFKRSPTVVPRYDYEPISIYIARPWSTTNDMTVLPGLILYKMDEEIKASFFLAYDSQNYSNSFDATMRDFYSHFYENLLIEIPYRVSSLKALKKFIQEKVLSRNG